MSTLPRFLRGDTAKVLRLPTAPQTPSANDMLAEIERLRNAALQAELVVVKLQSDLVDADKVVSERHAALLEAQRRFAEMLTDYDILATPQARRPVE